MMRWFRAFLPKEERFFDLFDRHAQTVIQGAFVLAKAGNDPALARESLDHLDRYIRLLFGRPNKE